MVGPKHDLKPFMGQKPDGEFLYTAERYILGFIVLIELLRE